MVQSQFSLCWDSYKNSICSGFSILQQNGEFVDMTLAADGHYVKVHQVLMAMASPYLKELITSIPCQHPVIFLNNISYKTLCLLLEYIYTGEVQVPADSLKSFAEHAKALHIKGIEHITSNEDIKNASMSKVHETGNRTLPIETTGRVKLPVSAKRIYIKPEEIPSTAIKSGSILPKISKVETHDYSEAMDDSGPHDDDDDDDDTYMDDHHSSMETSEMDNSKLTKDSLPATGNMQFTVSIRGSLQMILNRFIYNLNSYKSRAGVRRWRCVDYRNHKCSAYVITKNNVVLSRGNLHNHPYHDKKILSKLENKTVFSALDEFEAFREKEEKKNADNPDSSADHENFFQLNEYATEVEVKSKLHVENA